jgi:dTDP-glucose 4,6-dehydratase
MADTTILVTGGAGFIGSALVRHLVEQTDHQIVNADFLTYASNQTSLQSVNGNPRYHFEHVNICDVQAMTRLFEIYTPSAVLHLAAETHVDRSVDSPSLFVQTNVVGTFTLLEVARLYFNGLSEALQCRFRFLNVSTDEVFGSLGQKGFFHEGSSYGPNSPYAASKASADHFARSYHHTYGLPVLNTNCSNNYGPYQHPEKLVPTVILKALAGEPIPLYGQGDNVRDWLFVEDHVRGLLAVLDRGAVGNSYNIGTNEEQTNLDMTQSLCAILDELQPHPHPYADQIAFVKDRPGHDFRYAIDSSKLREDLGWKPSENFESGLRKTVRWYLEHLDWANDLLSGQGMDHCETQV